MVAMKKGADALKGIHSKLQVTPTLHFSYMCCAHPTAKWRRSIRQWIAFGSRWTLQTRFQTRSRIRSGWATWSTRCVVLFVVHERNAIFAGEIDADGRTSSKPSSRRWSRKNWTTDWPERIVYRCTLLHRLLVLQTVANVSCLFST